MLDSYLLWVDIFNRSSYLYLNGVKNLWIFWNFIQWEQSMILWYHGIMHISGQIKVRFLYQCSDHLSHSKNFTFLFPLIFLSKHISLYALGRIRWILDIIWPLNQHFKLKNQRNWLNQVWMWKFWNVMNCILLHWYKHLTLVL